MRNPWDLPKNRLLEPNFTGLYGYQSEEKKERDNRRTFTQTQRKEILYQQNSKCAECQKGLDPRDIEYDHKKPWAANGRTITQNGRAVCGSCHNIITHNTRLNGTRKKLDKKAQKKSSTPVILGFNWPKETKSETNVFQFPFYDGKNR